MIVRPADMERDALAILDGARDFVSRMTFTDFLPDTDDEFVEAVGYMIALPDFETWLVEHEGRIVGGIGLLFSPHPWNRKALSMSELFIWTAPDAPLTTFLRLMRKALDCYEARGGKICDFVKLESSPPGIERVYRKMGLVKVQESWMGAI